MAEKAVLDKEKSMILYNEPDGQWPEFFGSFKLAVIDKDDESLMLAVSLEGQVLLE